MRLVDYFTIVFWCIEDKEVLSTEASLGASLSDPPWVLGGGDEVTWDTPKLVGTLRLRNGEAFVMRALGVKLLSDNDTSFFTSSFSIRWLIF